MTPKPARDAVALPSRTFVSAAALSSWLAKHHGKSPGLWLKLAKKATGIESVSYAEAVEVALCWGWIDGHKRALDAEWWLQRFTPRAKKSIWSELNRKKALELIEAGRMKPAGLAEVQRAKDDGRWKAAYASAKTATVPADLTAALAKNARAREFFKTIDGTNRYAILFRIHQAKKPETRAARIARFVDMLAQGQKLHP